MKIEYLGHFGDDLMVVNAARVSFNKESEYQEVLVDEWNQTFELKEADKKLINYLAKNKHTTPFRHPQVQLRVHVPIFVANQLKRHVIGAAVNEVSRRYIDTPPEFYFPTEWRGRPPKSIKQGSSDEIITVVEDYMDSGERNMDIHQMYQEVVDNCRVLYENMIEAGVAPEMARMVLPQSMYTTWIWTGSIQFYAHLCKLRLDSHAQKESQMVAQQIDEIIRPLFPVSWPVLLEHI